MWAIATLTTVGYGDVYPITGEGKVIASLVAILGIGLFALPTGILGAGFVEEFQKSKTRVEKIFAHIAVKKLIALILSRSFYLLLCEEDS